MSLNRQYPVCFITLLLADRDDSLEQLLEERIDLPLTAGSEPDEPFECYPLCLETLPRVLPTDHPVPNNGGEVKRRIRPCTTTIIIPGPTGRQYRGQWRTSAPVQNLARSVEGGRGSSIDRKLLFLTGRGKEFSRF